MDIYAQNILAHYKNPRNHGPLTSPDATATVKNPYCGDVIELALKFGGQGKLGAVSFTGQGCAISQAAMSILSEELVGLSKEELLAFGREEMLAMLGIKIGPGRLKCALLGLRALRQVLGQAAPWRELIKA